MDPKSNHVESGDRESRSLTKAERERQGLPVKVIRGKGYVIEVPHVALARMVAEEDRCTYRWLGSSDHLECTRRKKPGKEMCAIHEEWHASAAAAYGMPCPVDDVSMHLFLMTLMGHLLDGRIYGSVQGQFVSIAKMMMRTVRDFDEKCR